MAAGGIIVRRNSRAAIAIVQRKRDNAWVLPKGKIRQTESPKAAAKREAMEETGCRLRVYEFLGVISYHSAGGPKIAHFWRMQAIGNAANSLTDDVRAVEWLPLSRAIERLSLPREQIFLRNVGAHALRKTQQIAAVTASQRGATVPQGPPAVAGLIHQRSMNHLLSKHSSVFPELAIDLIT